MCIPDRAHLIHDSLGPRESDAERRVDTFSRFRSARGRDQQTDQPPYVVTSLPGELLDTLLTTAAPYCTLHAWIAAREASNKCIAVSKVATPLRELTFHMGSHKCYLPPGRDDIPALTPAEAGTRLRDPGGMQG